MPGTQQILDTSYVCMLNCLCLNFATLWTAAHQAPLSMGILQARILEWVAISFSRGSSWPRDGTRGDWETNLGLHKLGSSSGRWLTPYPLLLISLIQHLTWYVWYECGWHFHLGFSELGQGPVWATHCLRDLLPQLHRPCQHWNFWTHKVSDPQTHLLEIVRAASASSSPKGHLRWDIRAKLRIHQDERSMN